MIVPDLTPTAQPDSLIVFVISVAVVMAISVLFMHLMDKEMVGELKDTNMAYSPEYLAQQAEDANFWLNKSAK